MNEFNNSKLKKDLDMEMQKLLDLNLLVILLETK